MAQSTHARPLSSDIQLRDIQLRDIQLPPWPQPVIACNCGATLNNPAIYYDSNEVAVDVMYRCSFCKSITIKETGVNYAERFVPYK